MKLWGGRFQKNTNSLVEDFHSSIGFDQRLYLQDIRGSIAHAGMLGAEDIIEKDEAARIIEGLKAIAKDIAEGKVKFSLAAEDIHMNIETLLIERVGDVGKKLHTGRSRNDQVALDIRMYLKDEITNTQKLLLELLEVLVDTADKQAATIMPGFTHLQIAQPITLGHHLLAYAEMFKRDYQRLSDCYRRVDVMPLGAGALAGTTFPLNRDKVAAELGFSGVSENSMDSVSDRDFIIEFLAAASVIMMHLSRLCEEIILWASQEFAFVELDDAYSTGSSIMPQKKNPDVAELIRGKTGRVYGDLMTMLSVMKGLPLAYNKDMQEDKEALFDGIDTVQKCLLVFAPMLKTMKFNAEIMYANARKGFSNATDLADYLVKKGLGFRDAHHVVGHLVNYCIEQGKSLEQLKLQELREGLRVLEKIEVNGENGREKYIHEDVYDALKLDNVVARRATYGGTSPVRVKEAVKRAYDWIAGQKL